jgi:hypothetical protein
MRSIAFHSRDAARIFAKNHVCDRFGEGQRFFIDYFPAVNNRYGRVVVDQSDDGVIKVNDILYFYNVLAPHALGVRVRYYRHRKI